jgi:hypothetical protein
MLPGFIIQRAKLLARHRIGAEQHDKLMASSNCSGVDARACPAIWPAWVCMVNAASVDAGDFRPLRRQRSQPVTITM